MDDEQVVGRNDTKLHEECLSIIKNNRRGFLMLPSFHVMLNRTSSLWVCKNLSDTNHFKDF
ncbi:unnamed protein product, partial [Vitis vinifera]